MGEWTEETIVISVPVTLEYDPSRVGREYLVAEAERGLTNALQHIAGYYRIEGGEAAVSDENERSVASTGSVADRCGLVAAMIQTGEDGGVFGIRIQERDDFPPRELIPLYLSPQLALTPAERRAIEYAAAFIHDKGLHRKSPSMVADVATLRGLLERAK